MQKASTFLSKPTHFQRTSVKCDEILTAVQMQKRVFWNVTPCSSRDTYQSFGETSHLHLQGRKTHALKLEEADSFETSEPLYPNYMASHPKNAFLFFSFQLGLKCWKILILVTYLSTVIYAKMQLKHNTSCTSSEKKVFRKTQQPSILSSIIWNENVLFTKSVFHSSLKIFFEVCLASKGN